MFPRPVLFINPKASLLSWPSPPRAVEPLGILCTAAAFRERGVETSIIDLDLHNNHEHLLRTLRLGEFGLVGIAMTSQMQVWDGFRVARDVKCMCPNAEIVVGGIFATMNSQWILDTCPEIDGVCRGEGEMLAHCYVDDPGPLSRLPNVLDRSELSVLTSAPRLPKYAATMDEYPWPARDLLPTVLRRGELPSIVTSRGCGATCSFCAIPAFSGMLWRMRSPSRIVDEIRQLHQDYGARRFHLIDDNLFGHTDESYRKAMQLLDDLAAMPEDLKFRAACRFDDLTSEALAKVKASGITLLKLGVETLGEATQRHYHKLLPEDLVAGRMQDILRAGIGISLGFIMFDPFCDLASVRRNFEFLLAFPDCWSRHLLRSRLEAYAGTAIEQRIWKAGLGLSRSAFGTRWKFQDEEVNAFHDRFEQAARSVLLPVEWNFYYVWQQNANERAGLTHELSPADLREIDGRIRVLSTELFKQALANQNPLPSNSLTQSAAELQAELESLVQGVDCYAVH
ncbi:MAG: B12-binding domain-containing radical SAM protein [Planctomycetaceae bacterium]|nr:B12-binding domain-containing radical SAM protein [Planctomycetaceae bacterium]